MSVDANERRELDFVETTEDLSASPLWNPDLAPTPLARQSTGNEIPYRVPACAFRTIGTSTSVLPSRMVTIDCHHVIPCCIRPDARV